MSLKLYYFALPGRAEASRLMLTGGKVDFEDVRMAGADWAALKPKTPFGQMPVLDVDGTMIAQSRAIDVYCAKLAGFYPEDPLVAAQADMVVGQLEDVWQVFASTFSMKELEEKIKARQELLAGAAKDKMTAVDKLLEGKEFVAGDKLSFADIALFCNMSMMKSGFMDGIPADVLDSYSNLKRLRNKVAQVDFVKAYYAADTENPRVAFKPDA